MSELIGVFVTIWKVSEMAFSCNEMYGIIPVKQITVTIAPKNLLLPYRKEIKSAILEILLTREILIIFFKIKIQDGAIIMGPK